MNQNTFIIILVIVILCCCSCSCCSYKETFIISNTGIYDKTLDDILKKTDDILKKLVEKQDNLSIFQEKILNKLDYTTGYKKLFNYNDNKRIKQIENISTSTEIIEELNILELNILYKNEIKELENNNIDNLNKYKNIIKTKYLIDNEIVKISIDEKVYEEVAFALPDNEPSYPTDTNELYYNEKILPIINEKIGSSTSDILIDLNRNEIEFNKSLHPNIFIMTEDGQIDKNLDNQIYLNDNFKKELKQSIDEYNIEVANTDILKNKVRRDFESGFYLGDGEFNIKREDY